MSINNIICYNIGNKKQVYFMENDKNAFGYIKPKIRIGKKKAKNQFFAFQYYSGI